MIDEKCDVLIVGCGIAGLSFALFIAETNPDLSIVMLNKGELPETNTRLAQGGIAAVVDHQNDSYEQHIQDTLLAGGSNCDHHVVKLVVKEAPERIQDLIRWGVRFNRKGTKFHLHREGGHSAHRILHQKDFTGKEIHEKLLARVMTHSSIKIKTNVFALDILIYNKRAVGLDCIDLKTGRYKRLLSRSLMLATGGCGHLFSHTTNYAGATGDGTAMAIRAGAQVKDLQFYQFHPTVLYQHDNEDERDFLISEAVRGAGGHILNASGERFLFRYDPRGEMATRDIVTAAIEQEMMDTETLFVYLSVTHLDMVLFSKQFPTIWKKCIDMGIDLKQAGIPVVPAAHYQCGGICVDDVGQSTIEGLYAGGECACTNLHGSNRLASNSLIEAVVFARRSANVVLKNIDQWEFVNPNTPRKIVISKESLPDIKEKKRKLQLLMDQVRYQQHHLKSLKEAWLQVDEWKSEISKHAVGIDRRTGEYLNLLENALYVINAHTHVPEKELSITHKVY